MNGKIDRRSPLLNLSMRKKLVYALGQFGFILCAYGAGKLFVSFFVTRSFYADPVFPVYLHPGYILGLFTAAGLILAVSRLVDAGAGLYFGWRSDANSSPKGRRTGLMVTSALPLAIFSVLVFFPPSEMSYVFNTVYVIVCAVAFYLFLSMYSVPYLALLAEIGETPRDRIVISTMMAFATGLASLLGNRIFFFSDLLNANTGLPPVWVFRIIIAVYAAVSFICMIIPARLINEKTLGPDVPVSGSFSESVSAVFRDSYFRHYFVADFMYRIAAAFTIAGYSFYVTNLLGLTVRDAGFFMLLIFFVGILLYVPVCLLVRRFGKRKLLFTALLLFMVFLVVAAFAGRYPFDPYVQGLVLSVLIAIPVAVFTVVPNALVADLAVVSERKTGDQRAGLYFGLYSLSEKGSQMVVAILFPWIISIGSAGTGLAGRAGLRISITLAAILSLTGFLFLFGYREKEVSAVLDRRD